MLLVCLLSDCYVIEISGFMSLILWGKLEDFWWILICLRRKKGVYLIDFLKFDRKDRFWYGNGMVLKM